MQTAKYVILNKAKQTDQGGICMGGLPVFDNHDDRIQYFNLLLERNTERIPHYDLPEGYHFEFYKDGDRDAWIEIEKSAKEFVSFEQGLAAWDKYYLGREHELPGRMIFAVNEIGEKAATATAFYDIDSGDDHATGWLHWVSVKRSHQGRGLSKPLISRTLERLKELGYTRIKIPTQTTSWLACKIYLDFGFLPEPQNALQSLGGWRIIKRLTDHPSLSRFRAAEDWEVLNRQGGNG